MKKFLTAPLIASLSAALAVGPHVQAQTNPPPPAAASAPTTPTSTSDSDKRKNAPAPVRRRGPAVRGTNRDGSLRNTTVQTPIVTPAPGSPAAAIVPSAPPMEVPGEKEFNQCKKIPPGVSMKLNLKPETEISDLIGWISTITCTPFLVPSTVQLQGKKVTVIAPEKVAAAEAYRLFYAALESVGLTVEPSGKFLRIMDTQKARQTPLPYYGSGDAVPRDKRYITKLVRVENLDTNELLNAVLNRIKSDTGDVISYRSSLIITDTAENVERMVQIIKDFDLPSANAESLWMVRIKNMSASEMALRLAEILPVQQGVSTGRRPGTPGAPMPAAPAAAKPATTQFAMPGDLNAEMSINKIVVDERSNSLLVVANRRAYDWLITLVRKLDQPLDGGGSDSGDGKVHVYSCENANCDELAATLSAVAGVSVVGASANRRPRTSTGQTGFAPPTPTPMAAGAQGANQQGSPLLFEGDVRITFDAPTNSLLVVSSFKDFQALRKLIAKLDAPRKQVFIEALVLEVSMAKDRTIGVGYHGGGPLNFPGNDQSLVLGGFEPQTTLQPSNLISSLGGLTGALFGPTIPSQNLSIFGTTVLLPSFGVFLQLLQKNSDVNVLSNPSLLITNNQEGEITIGQNLPFPGQLLGGFGGFGTGAAGTTGGSGFGGFPSVGVQRQNVALTMRITPSVNEHNMIRLDIDETIEDVFDKNYNGLGPATSKRAAKTQVMARDEQTVVIGGLMADRKDESVKKVPILGDIPVLGFLFRSTVRTSTKQNLIIALTPYVISDASDLRRVAEKKLRERREFIERYSSIEDHTQIESDIDYRRKRGMLEEINRTAREAEDEEAELRRIRQRDLLDDSAVVEPPGRGMPLARPLVPASRVVPASTAPAPAAIPGAVPAPVTGAPVPTTPPPAAAAPPAAAPAAAPTPPPAPPNP